MLRFWLLIIACFVVLLLTVHQIGKRNAQLDAIEAFGAPRTSQPPTAPMPQPLQAPRSELTEAASGELYKCVNAQGHLSFQSQPCPSDATQAWVRDATPEPDPSPEQRLQQARARQAADRDAASRPASQGYWSGAPATTRSPSSACQAARAADAAYRRQPLRYITHDGLRRHGDQVNAACY